MNNRRAKLIRRLARHSKRPYAKMKKNVAVRTAELSQLRTIFERLRQMTEAQRRAQKWGKP